MTIGVITVATLFSVVVAYHQLFALNGLHALAEYDDGVWFGSAVRIANGALPYRGFVLDQPPGVPAFILPFALLSRIIGTRDAFAAARLVTPLAGAVTVMAAGWLVRHRGGLAVAVSSGVAAIYPWALVDERTVMLEPYCAMLCLLGLVAAFDGDRLSDSPRRVTLAGIAFGLAGSCKLFAVLPFAVLVVAFLASRNRLRRVLALSAGAGIAVLAVCGPFFALAPQRFLHQVVATQLLRSSRADSGIWNRLFSLIGVLPATHFNGGYPDDSHLADGLVVALFAALVIGGWMLRASSLSRSSPRCPTQDCGSRRARVSPLDLTIVAVVVVVGGALLEPPAYYDHYSAFFAPFLAVSLGLTASSLALRLRPLIATVVVVALVAGAVHSVHLDGGRQGSVDVAQIDSLIPPNSCVVTDNPPLLILANRFSSTRSRCPAMVDSFGTTISAGDGAPPNSPKADVNGAGAVWRHILANAQYLVLTYGYAARRIPWTLALIAYAQAHFRALLPSSPLVLVRRTPG